MDRVVPRIEIGGNRPRRSRRQKVGDRAGRSEQGAGDVAHVRGVGVQEPDVRRRAVGSRHRREGYVLRRQIVAGRPAGQRDGCLRARRGTV